MKKRLWIIYISMVFVLCACGKYAASNKASTSSDQKAEDIVENEPDELSEERTTDTPEHESVDPDSTPNNNFGITQVDWDKIADRKTISIKPRCFVGINDDGTVSATGINDAGECDIDDWEDIISVEAGGFHTVGLKSDGTVVTTVPGNDTYNVSDVGNWKNIVAIAAGRSLTVGLRDDGTVVATGRNEDGECNVSSWRDIIAIAVGYRRTIGLRIDGTVVATGENKYGECDVSGWTDIVAIYAGERQTIGIKEDGTLVTTGDYSKEPRGKTYICSR